MDMTEEHTPGLDWGVRQAGEHLGALQEVDPESLVEYLDSHPGAAARLTEALANLAALGREAAELLEMIP